MMVGQVTANAGAGPVHEENISQHACIVQNRLLLLFKSLNHPLIIRTSKPFTELAPVPGTPLEPIPFKTRSPLS